MSDHRRLRLVDSTLREGEQQPGVSFSSDDQVEIALALDAFGIDVIEVPTPIASPRAESDVRRLADLGLKAQLACHTRCRPDEILRAAHCGADMVHVYLGSSLALQQFGHGQNLPRILNAMDAAADMLTATQLPGRFSCEDAFRTPIGDLSRILLHAEELGFERVGIADTVGAASPEKVTDVVRFVRQLVKTDIEFHGHNDGGCAIANAQAAFHAGATHVDVTSLGLGERNGITSLSGLVACLWLNDRSSLEPYELSQLIHVDELVAERAGISVPFSSCISGPHVFTHKAGPHIKAVVAQPSTYESLDPSIFGRERSLDVAHRLTGRHAILHRAQELGLDLTTEALQEATKELKSLADRGHPTSDVLDSILRQWQTRKGQSHGNAL